MMKERKTNSLEANKHYDEVKNIEKIKDISTWLVSNQSDDLIDHARSMVFHDKR